MEYEVFNRTCPLFGYFYTIHIWRKQPQSGKNLKFTSQRTPQMAKTRLKHSQSFCLGHTNMSTDDSCHILQGLVLSKLLFYHYHGLCDTHRGGGNSNFSQKSQNGANQEQRHVNIISTMYFLPCNCPFFWNLAFRTSLRHVFRDSTYLAYRETNDIAQK